MGAPWDGPAARLRGRRSAKWTTFDDDVLPLPVAEMDVTLAPPVGAALHAAVAASDTGYAGDVAPLRAAFAGFAARRWGWRPEPSGIRTCADVAVGVTEVLRCVVRPGDGVVLMPPVYPPFWQWIDAVGARPVEVPLRAPATGGRLDLPGIGAALAAGARAVLLCHPHNPTGRVHDVAELRALAALAARYGATVLADEIHAPLTLPGQAFRPYLTVSEDAAATGIAFHSASKAWNLAGLKCALIVAPAGRRDVPAALPAGLSWGVGHLGVLAATAAYDEGDAWLDALREGLDGNVALLADLLAEHLPAVTFHRPQAGFLAWLDCRGVGLGHDPAAILLRRARVALSPGPDFGPPGHGFARLNFACHPDLLREAVGRLAAACGGE